MKVIIGNQYYGTLEAQSVRITRSASDPVPTCTLNLIDNSSSIVIPALSEILVLDDQMIPTPTVNMISNPTLNPYNSNGWQNSGNTTGVTFSQHSGGGGTITLSNAANLTIADLYQFLPIGAINAGQTYTVSFTIQATSPVGYTFYGTAQWLDAASNQIGSIVTLNGPVGVPPTTATSYSTTMTAPAGATSYLLTLGIITQSGTNSGTTTYTNVQMEPNWFSTVSYPTAFCGPNQTNCRQLPIGYWVRQYRRFAGFVTHTLAQNYHGNARTLQIDAVGYAWLMGTIICNDSFTSKTDAQIISSLLTKYLVSTTPGAGSGTALLSTANVVTGVSLSQLQSNWDDLRTIFDGLAGISGFYWTVDDYWNMIYAPPGYYTMPISLICDYSLQPNFTTTFPAYNFSAETDITQPGSTILVIGSGTNVAEVIDPVQVANLGQTSGYFLPIGTSWMRKINDSTLASNTDCANRGIAELLQYDKPRNLYHLSANVELLAGQGVAITSATEGLNASVALIQQITAQWLGTNETLTDEWEYQADLGATNRAATQMISRIHRLTQRNTSAPAIGTTVLATFEKVNVSDSIDGNSLYAQAVLADSPLRYYRLGEPAGFSITTAYDWSGNAQNGTINSSVTLGTTGLIYNDLNTAMTFNGTTSYISLPTAGLPTGAAPWSLEAWVEVSMIPGHTYNAIVGFGKSFGTNLTIAQLSIQSNGTTAQFLCSTYNGDILGGNVSVNTIYHVVGSYDGVNTRLFVNGALVAGPTPFTPAITLNYASIGAENSNAQDFFPGTIDEVCIYGYALPISQILKHYAAGTGKSLGNLYTAYSLYAGTIFADQPVAYYRLDEAAGTTVYDWQINNLLGTVNGGITLSATGLLFNDSDTAMTFDGSSGYIQLPMVGAWPTGNGQWTIECWCKPTNSTNANNGHLITLGNPGTNSAVASICQTSTGGWGVVTGGGPGHDFQGNGTSIAGTTYYIAATYDGSNLRVYVGTGGTLTTYGPFSPGSTLALTASAHQSVGNAWNGSAQAFFFNGTIDEPACYNVALSQARLQAHYNIGALGHL